MKLYNASIILFYAAFVMPIILIMYIAAAIMDFAAFLIDSICSICLSISNAIYSSIKLIDSSFKFWKQKIINKNSNNINL